MKLSSLLGPAGGVLGKRFLLVSYLPTTGCAVFLVVLVWAGAPGSGPDFSRAWQTAGQLGAGELLLLWLAITLVAVAAHPLQLRLVRLLEGDWPRILGPLRRLSVLRQRTVRTRLQAAAIAAGDPPSPAEENRAGLAWSESVTRFPPPSLEVASTALGNALAAMEYYVGSAHGLDVVVTWPRLHPLVQGAAKEAVDSFRDALDAAARLAVTAGLTSLVTVWLLWEADWWPALALAPALLARMSYLGAVQAAVGYGAALDAAIDTNRFALYEQLRLPLPENPEAERALALLLCTHWRQRVALPDPLAYLHPGTRDTDPGGDRTGDSAGGGTAAP
ncbi:hypothetical protein ACODT3_39530 [Streptomyces sp. 4.24]|uniref:hypothetical protein n=1 Tax=Streptomyces tritrimontium TaxID=3406573 RepID=UPI003BB55E7B